MYSFLYFNSLKPYIFIHFKPKKEQGSLSGGPSIWVFFTSDLVDSTAPGYYFVLKMIRQ